MQEQRKRSHREIDDQQHQQIYHYGRGNTKVQKVSGFHNIDRQTVDFIDYPGRQNVFTESGKPLHIAEVRKQETSTKTVGLENLPTDMFFHILSYLGPHSNNLASLAQTTKYHNSVLTKVGDAMLKKANTAFRIPLIPLHPSESSISISIRHARSCATACERLSQLEKLISNDFDKNFSKIQVNGCINMALDLLDVNCSRYLEGKILAMCSKCGGKAFKYSKIVQNETKDDEERVKNTHLLMQRAFFRKIQVVGAFKMDETAIQKDFTISQEDQRRLINKFLLSRLLKYYSRKLVQFQ